MSVLQTVLLYVLVPLGIVVLISLLAAGRGLVRRRPRYRPDEPWTYPPVWWAAHPDSTGLPEVDEHAGTAPAGSNRGGADDRW